MSKCTVAVVGRPNVGKSTFFNKIAGERISIVEDTPGVTRDRIYCDVDWNGRQMLFIDTGGIEPTTENTLLRQMRDQALIAIGSADVIIFMTELGVGVTAADREIASMLKKSRKPVVVAVNKVDTIGEVPAGFYEFYELGFDDVIPVSSVHGSGTGDILDKVIEYLPPEEVSPEEEGAIRVAVIGKPNAGKSSIINRIVGEERVIVSDMAGTTRDAIDTFVENQHGKYIFVDTAGIRRSAKVEDRIEKYSVIRANAAVEKADVCLVMIDANEGVTAQDERIAGLAHNAGKASIIVINKWDSIEKDNSSVKNFQKEVLTSLTYMRYAQTAFVSALTGQRVDKLYQMINNCYENANRRITTGLLNDFLADVTARVQPPSDKGRRLKIYYMTQTGVCPPTFVLFCNDAELFHFSYQRYIENCLRESFDFSGTPIRLVIKQKGENPKGVMRYLFELVPQMFNLMGGLDSSNLGAITITAWIITAIAGYLLGSLNSAIIVSKWKFKQDIRSFGSGNAGLTNMHRVYGKDGAVYTLVGDIAKQILSVLIGAILLGRYGAYLAGAFCMIGHIFPVYYKFKGGKGVLTAATMILIIDPLVFLILFVIFALTLLLTRYVSLSSIIAAISYPAVIRVAYGMEHAFELFFALFVGCVVIFMHRSNLYRLFNNQESKFSFRKKPEAQEVLDMEDRENDADNTYYPPATEKKGKGKGKGKKKK